MNVNVGVEEDEEATSLSQANNDNWGVINDSIN